MSYPRESRDTEELLDVDLLAAPFVKSRHAGGDRAASARAGRTGAGESSRRSAPPRVDEEEVRRRAYERYLARGGAPGSALDDWLAAEHEVRAAARRAPRGGPEAATRTTIE